MSNATVRLTVWAPATPGADVSCVGTADTMAEARKIAAQYSHRRDLKMQDVYIRLGKDGKIVEGNMGPCR